MVQPMGRQVDPEDFSHELCRLRAVASTFVKSDSDVVRMMLRPPVLLNKDKCYMLSALIKASPPPTWSDCRW